MTGNNLKKLEVKIKSKTLICNINWVSVKCVDFVQVATNHVNICIFFENFFSENLKLADCKKHFDFVIECEFCTQSVK
jgi:hypothetical protein